MSMDTIILVHCNAIILLLYCYYLYSTTIIQLQLGYFIRLSCYLYHYTYILYYYIGTLLCHNSTIILLLFIFYYYHTITTRLLIPLYLYTILLYWALWSFGKMSASRYSDRRFIPRLHLYIVILSKTLNQHCVSRLFCEMSTRREGGLF